MLVRIDKLRIKSFPCKQAVEVRSTISCSFARFSESPFSFAFYNKTLFLIAITCIGLKNNYRTFFGFFFGPVSAASSPSYRHRHSGPRRTVPRHPQRPNPPLLATKKAYAKVYSSRSMSSTSPSQYSTVYRPPEPDFW